MRISFEIYKPSFQRRRTAEKAEKAGNAAADKKEICSKEAAKCISEYNAPLVCGGKKYSAVINDENGRIVKTIMPEIINTPFFREIEVFRIQEFSPQGILRADYTAGNANLADPFIGKVFYDDGKTLNKEIRLLLDGNIIERTYAKNGRLIKEKIGGSYDIKTPLTEHLHSKELKNACCVKLFGDDGVFQQFSAEPGLIKNVLKHAKRENLKQNRIFFKFFKMDKTPQEHIISVPYSVELDKYKAEPALGHVTLERFDGFNKSGAVKIYKNGIINGNETDDYPLSKEEILSSVRNLQEALKTAEEEGLAFYDADKHGISMSRGRFSGYLDELEEYALAMPDRCG